MLSMQCLTVSFQKTYEVVAFTSTHDVKGKQSPEDLGNFLMRNSGSWTIDYTLLKCRTWKILVNYMWTLTPPEAPTRARTVHVKWKVMFRAQRGNYVVTRKVHGEENLGVDSGSATFQPHGLSSVSNPPWVRFLRPRNENNNTYCINLLGLP